MSAQLTSNRNTPIDTRTKDLEGMASGLEPGSAQVGPSLAKLEINSSNPSSDDAASDTSLSQSSTPVAGSQSSTPIAEQMPSKVELKTESSEEDEPFTEDAPPFISGLDDIEKGARYDEMPKGWTLPVLKGGKDESVFKWERKVRETLQYCQIRKEMWVRLATDYLQGEALEWWGSQPSNMKRADWSDFIKAIKKSDFHVRQQKSLKQKLHNIRFDGNYDKYNSSYTELEGLLDPEQYPFKNLLRWFLKPLPVEHQQILLMTRPSYMASLHLSTYGLPKIKKDPTSTTSSHTATPAKNPPPAPRAFVFGGRPAQPSGPSSTAAAAGSFTTPTAGISAASRIYGETTQGSDVNGFGFANAPQPCNVNVSQPPSGGFGSPSAKPRDLPFAPLSTQQKPSFTFGGGPAAPSSSLPFSTQQKPAFSFGGTPSAPSSGLEPTSRTADAPASTQQVFSWGN